jgi:hypothetical protein
VLARRQVVQIRSKAQNNLPGVENPSTFQARSTSEAAVQSYFGGAGVNPSRLCAGSGLGFGLGAFLTSFLPLSLLPMAASVPQKGGVGEEKNTEFQIFKAMFVS